MVGTMTPSFRLLFPLLSTVNVAFSLATEKQTRYNPAVPSWHSNRTCVFVPEGDNTTFCTSWTFLLTPGLPIHARKYLINWKLVGHALSRES
jgi:beta-xylosidase